MLGRKAIVQFLSDNFVNLIGFISTFIIARFMGPSVLGVIGYNLSLVSILSIFSDLGYSQAHIKRISEGGDIQKKTGTYLLIKIILTLLFSLSTILFLIQGKEKDINIPVFVLIFLSVIINHLTQTITCTFQGLQKTFLNNIPILLGRTTKTLLTIIVVFLSLGTIGVALTYTLESIIVLLISIILFNRFLKNIYLNTDYFKSYTRYAFPIAGTIISSYIVGNTDKLLIKNFWDIKEVGVYFGIQSLMALPQSISSALMTIFFPKASELLSKKDTESLRLHLIDAIKFLSMIIFPVCSLLIIYSKEIPLIFFGTNYPQASSIMIVGALTAVVITFVRPYSNILYALEKGRSMFFIGIISLVVLIASDLLLIPESLLGFSLPGLKGVGAAIGILAMWTVNGFLVLFIVRKNINIFPLRSLVKVLFATIPSVILVFIIKAHFIKGIFGIIIGSSIFLLIYIFFLKAFKILRKKEVSYILELINLKSMTSYLKKEVKET